MPTFSIVIPTRNRPRLLSSAVQSVLSNSYGSFEIIVADNSDPGLRMEDNPDYTQQEHEDYTSRVRVLEPIPRRLSMWGNYKRGAAAATGNWVIMLNDKCILSPWALVLLNNAINRAEQVGVGVVTWPVPFRYSFNPRRDPGEGSKFLVASEIMDAFNRWDYTNPYDWDVFPHGCNCAYKRFSGHEEMYSARNPDYLQGHTLVTKRGGGVWHTTDDIMFIPRGLTAKYSVGASHSNNTQTSALMEYRADCGAADKPLWNDYTYDNVLEDMRVRATYTPEYKAGVYRSVIDRARAGGGWMNHYALHPAEFSPRAALITLRRLTRDVIRRFCT